MLEVTCVSTMLLAKTLRPTLHIRVCAWCLMYLAASSIRNNPLAIRATSDLGHEGSSKLASQLGSHFAMEWHREELSEILLRSVSVQSLDNFNNFSSSALTNIAFVACVTHNCKWPWKSQSKLGLATLGAIAIS